jgi:2-polyprenyl-3-methyl-5-hydroxy-6-metoxy-1,4-benzoquinol methylase/GNAT superfamily N-acetyltransferase
VVWAEAFGQMVGYAIAVHAKLPGHGNISWVTQLVVQEEHRNRDVGKTLLFTVWRFSDYFAWGILSANPYAIRALEKATRRRCQPARIAMYAAALHKLGEKKVPYVHPSTEVVITAVEAKINTGFFLDHSELPSMLASATSPEKPWILGTLPEGWEWFAFTFHDQKQITLNSKELKEMLIASDKVTKLAYSRMHPQKRAQAWARHGKEEIDFVIDICGIGPGDKVLDFGCGDGRHVMEFAQRGIEATGIDYLHSSIEEAQGGLNAATAPFVKFQVGDCRTIDLDDVFNVGICLYDVIGSYVDDRDNLSIISNLAKHIAPGGYIILSVMNMELTERINKNWFSVSRDPDKLLDLPPSRTMEKTGDVFNPDYYMIDRDTRTVYRKEQFGDGDDLFDELLVRDRRYTEQEIKQCCFDLGLEVIWTRFVRAGNWAEPIDRVSNKAKEILVLCRKPLTKHIQQTLFDLNS